MTVGRLYILQAPSGTSRQAHYHWQPEACPIKDCSRTITPCFHPTGAILSCTFWWPGIPDSHYHVHGQFLPTAQKLFCFKFGRVYSAHQIFCRCSYYRAWPGRLETGGLTNYCPSVLDTVGWVIWPVKIVPNKTYNVFGGTLNPTLLLLTKLTFYLHTRNDHRAN